MSAELDLSPPEVPEPTLLESLLRYGLFLGAIFQLICILAVIIPSSKGHEQVNARDRSGVVFQVNHNPASFFVDGLLCNVQKRMHGIFAHIYYFYVPIVYKQPALGFRIHDTCISQAIHNCLHGNSIRACNRCREVLLFHQLLI